MTAKVAYLNRAAEARRNIPQVIRLLLAVSGRTGKDLAGALGMPTSRLSERLSGKVRISSDELAACALFFGVDAGLFYRDPGSFRAALGLSAEPPSEEPAEEADLRIAKKPCFAVTAA